MLTLFINLAGLLLIAVITWWFLIAKPKTTLLSQSSIDIIVKSGVYEPAVIQAKQGQKLRLRFIRLDETPCSEFVLFDDFNVSVKLPINEPRVITITPPAKGEFEFTCQMGMYRGVLRVV